MSSHTAQTPCPSDPNRQEAVTTAKVAGEPYGLLAAWGKYPQVVAESLRQQGYRVCCLAVKDHADPQLADVCDEFAWIGAARFTQALRFFEQHGVRRATMAGKFHKVMLYRPWLWLRHIPDLRFLKTFHPYFVTGRADRKDDTILGAIVDAFAREGITFEPATNLLPEVLAPEGILVGKSISERRMRDIEFGWKLAKEMGRLDVGQSVCVKDQAVLAIEAIEGTDLCIRRAGELCEQGGFTLVKVAKPQQDMRFDVPTVGTRTLESLHQAGGKVLAIEANRTILLDSAEFFDVARRYRIDVVSMREPTTGRRVA